MAKVDCLVYGATGFTGCLVAHELAAQLSTVPSGSWAIGGRSRERLGRVATEIAAAHPGAPRPHLVVADAQSDTPDTLMATFGSAKVVVNCAGPFARFGQRVVEACVGAGASYVDISGEPRFILGTMLEEEADPRALQNECLIISACGFDSIPAEIGCLFTANRLRQLCSQYPDASNASGDTSSHIESIIRIVAEDRVKTLAHVTTLECALMGLQSADDTRRIRRALEGASVRPTDPVRRTPPARAGFFRDARAAGEYVTLFPGSDSTIAKQTLRLVAADRTGIETESRWHSYTTYVVVGGVLVTFKTIAFAIVMFIVKAFPGGTNLILRNPGRFTNNVFTSGGPSPTDREGTSITIDFFGKRYAGNTLRAEVTSRISISDPGYAATARMVVAAARTITEERDRLPRGGVFTPAAAFAKSSLIDRLVSTNALRIDVLNERVCEQ
jgi:short subunit dehydrogenase-like uncharacterized protein